MKSASNISPGVGFGISLVVVDDLDILGASIRPNEADAPLLIDSDAMLAGAIILEGFKLIAGRHSQVAQHLGIVQHSQLPQRGLLDILWQLPAEFATPYPLGLGTPETDDHEGTITLRAI
jgi:hypothetical protein